MSENFKPSLSPTKPSGNKAGRKWFDGKDEEDVISQCKEVWAYDGSDAEAAFYAEISKQSLSRYLKKHENIKELRDRLRQQPILKARKTVVDNLDKDPAFALRYLGIKRKDEFGTGLGFGGDDGIPIALVKFVGSDGKEKERKSGRDHVS